MPDPTIRQGHVDQLLTNLSVAYQQRADRFIADRVFPVVPVAKASDFYFHFPRGAFLRDEVGPRPLGGYPRQVGYKVEKKTYYAEEEALEAFLDDRERANATPPNDPERSKVQLLVSQHMIHREQRWADAYFKPGVWGTDLTGVAAAPAGGQFLQWNDAASDPVGVIDTHMDAMAQQTGLEGSVLVLGRRVYRRLRNHPDIIDRIKYTQQGRINDANGRTALAAMFGVNQVLVPSAIRNTAAEGETDNFSWIMSDNDALLVHAAAAPGIDTPSAGYIFSWTGLLGPNAFNTPSAVWRGRDDRAYSDWFHVRMAYDMQVVSPELGIFFNDAVAATS